VNARGKATRAIVAATCLVAASLSGCTSFPWQKVPLDSKSGFYTDAALTYRLDAGKLGQPLDVLRIDGQRVSYEQVASSPLPDESIGTLAITYPHPAGRQGVALARFTLSSTRHESKIATPLWNPFAKRADVSKAPTAIASVQPEMHETWELDIGADEFNHIVKLLNDIGFYHDERPGAAELTVKMDGIEQSKSWDEVPALNLLVRRVRTSGRLVAYACPKAPAGAPVSPITSTLAYQNMIARHGLGGPAASDTLVASAFSLGPPVATPAPPVPGVAPAMPGYPPAGALAARWQVVPNQPAQGSPTVDPNNPYAAVLAGRPPGTIR
jgi:hypothetical protein